MANNNNWMSYINQLEDQLDLYLNKKAPQLPTGVKDFIVSVAPWLTLIGVIFSVLGILAVIGLSAVALPLMAMGANGHGLGVISIILWIVTVVLEAMAISPLMKRQKKGWDLIFYATLVSALENLLSLNLVGLVIGALISWYILFQVRSHYK